jgi:hypothetical protein
LWDVPSQYGFLSILTLALIPTRTAWQAFYLANSLLLFLSAAILFHILRSLRAGVANLCLSLGISLASVFMLAGWGPALAGPQITPAAAAYRFFWCYALLAVLVWEFRTDPRSRAHSRILAAGCAVWLLGTLWSSESAVYSAAIWLPAYALIVLRRTVTSVSPSPRLPVSWSPCLRLAVPPLLLLAALAPMTAYYSLRLGHTPDWQMFTEYARWFKSGFMALPIDTFGPVWVLFVAFCILSMTVACLLRAGLAHRALPMTVGATAGLWAASSYFVSRSHPINALDLSPVLFTAVAVALLALTAAGSDPWRRLIRMSLVPVVTVLLTATFGNPQAFPNYPAALWNHAYTPAVEAALPQIDPSLASLLASAGLKPSDSMVYFHRDLLPAWPYSDGVGGSPELATRAWLPITPLALLAPLPKERSDLYIARFTARARASGWLIEPTHEPGLGVPSLEPDGFPAPWLRAQLARSHRPVRMVENEDYRLTWFEFAPSGEQAAQQPPGASLASNHR